MKCVAKILLVVIMLFTQMTFVNAEGLKSIEQQVVEYAKSINQNNADNTAAWSLANYGITGNGKLYNMNQNHAFTATLVNSNVGLEFLKNSINVAINHLQKLNIDEIFVNGSSRWSGIDDFYAYSIYSSSNFVSDNIIAGTKIQYMNKLNSYDQSLIWMAGDIDSDIHITKIDISENVIVYNVHVEYTDRFDFRSGNGSISKDIASILGSFMFNEFDWKATIEFQVVASNLCPHESSNYSFSYDNETKGIVSYGDEEYKINRIEKYEYAPNEEVKTYFQLEQTIRLLHDKPWEFEYRVTNPDSIALSAADTNASKLSYFINYRTHSLWFPITRDGTKHYYGILASAYFKYNQKDVYCFSYKNVIEEEGNMIYISVFNETQNKLVLDYTPMDDYYLIIDGQWVYIDNDDDSLSGEDFDVNYIGNRYFSFEQDLFDLKIWENGKENSNYSYYEKSNTVKPTCTSQGYTTYECSVCGHTKKDDYVAKLGHSFTNYVSNNDSTVEKDGTKTAKCDRCDTTSTITDTGSKLVVDSISIKSLPTKLEYVEGQELELDGLVVEATYTNGKTEEISNYEVTGYNKDSLGTQWLTVSYYGKSTSFAVNVIKNIKLEVEENIFINYGGTYQLNVNVIPTSSKVTYSTSNTKVATVDKKGKITAKSLGTTILTVKADNGLEATCTVTVKLKDVTTKVSRASDTSLKVSWNKVSGASGYVVYRSTTFDGEYKKVKTITKNSTVSWTDTKKTTGTTYYYKVRAYRTVNGKKVYGEYSPIVGYAPLKTPSVSIDKISYDTIHVSWKSVKYAENYELYRSLDNKTYELITITSDLGYLDENLLTGKTYYYKVKAVKDCESNLAKSAYSTYKSLKLSLDKPSLTVSNPNYTCNELRWNTIEGASMYQVYRSTKEKGTYTKVAETKDRSYVDTNVKVGTTYYYKVRAYHVNSDESKGYGSYSKIISKKVVLPKPTNVVVSRIDSKTAEITFESVYGAEGYEIYRATSKTGTYTKVKTTSELSYTNTKLSNKTYYYKVRAYRIVNNKKVYSSYSSVITCKK